MSAPDTPGAAADAAASGDDTDGFAAPPEPGEPDDIWSKQDKRHPVLLALACIATANALVPVIWHNGYPHQPGGGCHGDQTCSGMQLWASLKNAGSHAVSIIMWRRNTVYGKGLERDTLSSEREALLAKDTALWNLGIDLESALADLRRAARAMGLPIADPSPLANTRTYTGELLTELTGRPLPAPVPTPAATMVALRRALARARQLAERSTRVRVGVAAVWQPYLQAFGPRHSADAVAFHKTVVSRFDDTHRRVRDALARGVDNLTAVQRYELLCDQQRLELLAEQVQQIAALYHVPVNAQDLLSAGRQLTGPPATQEEPP